MKKYFSTAADKFPRIQTQILINGKFRDSVSGKIFDVLNPSTEEILAKVQSGSKEDIDLAVKSSKEAFEKGSW